MSIDRVALIETRLRAALAPSALEILDDSWKHAGHAGARQGGHFTVRVTSSAFAGLRLIQRHRLIYDALGEAMKTEIHALQIEARAPGEVGA